MESPFKGFLPHWTNSILQQLKRKFGKIADALFRISRMTNSFKYEARCFHQETPPNYKDVLFSRCFKMTCKMFYYSKRCFKFWKHLKHVLKHLEHVQNICKMFQIFKVSFGCFETSFRHSRSHQRCPINYEMFWLKDVLIREMLITFKTSFWGFKTSFWDSNSRRRCPINCQMFWFQDVLIRKMF
jgi:hypothetical protein